MAARAAGKPSSKAGQGIVLEGVLPTHYSTRIGHLWGLVLGAAMAPKKRPAKGEDDAGPRVGFKDYNMLSTVLGPHINERFFTTYTTSRSLKHVEKKKLLSK